MNLNTIFFPLLVLAFPTPPYAQVIGHSNGEHPAVLVKRQQANATYDYQAQFYPHPAWLYLETDRHEMGEHPAVLVARRYAEEQAAAQQSEQQMTALVRRRATADTNLR